MADDDLIFDKDYAKEKTKPVDDLVFDKDYAKNSDLVFEKDPEFAQKTVISEMFDKKSAITKSELDKKLQTLDPSLHADIKKALVNGGIDDDGKKLYTTADIINTETEMISNAKAMASNKAHDLTDAEIAAAISKKEAQAGKKLKQTVTMTDEQKMAIAHGLRGGFSIVQGSAGAGKSFGAEAINIAYTDKGYEVIGAAVAKRAAQNLQDETGIKSVTVASLVNDLNSGKKRLNDQTVIVIDEAGQVGTKQFNALLFHANAAGAKIVATGEDKQLEAIQQGGALRYLSRPDVIGCARIENIVRQNDPLDRNAVMNLRDGKAARAIMHYDQKGLIDFSDNKPQAIDSLINDWQKYEAQNPGKESLIIAHRNQDVRLINEKVREIRKAQGVIHGDEIMVNGAHGSHKFDVPVAIGDRLRLNKNDKELDAINGDIGNVFHMERNKEKGGYDLYLKLDRGEEIVINTKSYVNDEGRTMISGANAMTVYSSQGVTVKGDAFVLQTASMDRANTYVAASRAKENTHLYVPSDEISSLKELVKNASRDNSKSLVTETLETEREKMMDEAQKREEAGKKYYEQQQQMAKERSAHNEPLMTAEKAAEALKNGEKPKVVFGNKEDENKAREHRQDVINEHYPFHSGNAFYSDAKFTSAREQLQDNLEQNATPEDVHKYINQYHELKSAYKEEMQIAITAEMQINEIQEKYGQKIGDLHNQYSERAEYLKQANPEAEKGFKEVADHYKAMFDKEHFAKAKENFQADYNDRKEYLEQRREVGGMRGYSVEGVVQPDVAGKTSAKDHLANFLEAVGASNMADNMRGITQAEKDQMALKAETKAVNDKVDQLSEKIKYAKTDDDKQWLTAARSMTIHAYNARRYEDAINSGDTSPKTQKALEHAQKRMGERANEMGQIDMKRMYENDAAKERVSKVYKSAALVNHYTSEASKQNSLAPDVQRGVQAEKLRDQALERAETFKDGYKSAGFEAKRIVENQSKADMKSEQVKQTLKGEGPAPSHNSANNRRFDAIRESMQREEAKPAKQHQKTEERTR